MSSLDRTAIVLLSLLLWGMGISSLPAEAPVAPPAEERAIRFDPAKNSLSGRRFAVLIGVNKYYNLADLSYCENDMKALYKQLLDIGFDSKNVFMLTPSMDLKDHPRKEYIEATLRHVLDVVRAEDTVIIAMAGHGAEIDGKACFCPMDTDPEQLQETTIPINNVFRELNQSEAKFKLLIVDACRETMTNTRSIGNAARSLKDFDFNPPAGIAMMQSCGKGEFSYELAELQHGAFTHFLIEGLQGKADMDRNGTVTFLELQQFVSARTKDRVFRETKKHQNPSFSLKDLSDFPIAAGFVEISKESLKEPLNDDKAPSPVGTSRTASEPSAEELVAMIPGLRQRVRADKNDPEAKYLLGAALYYQAMETENSKGKLGDLKSSSLFLKQAVALKSDNPNLSSLLARVEQEIDRTETKTQQSRSTGTTSRSQTSATPPRPLTAEDHYYAGVEKISAGNHADAFRDLNSALRLKPNYPEALAMRAIVYMQSNKLNDAMVDIKKAISLDPKNSKYRETQGTIQKRMTSATSLPPRKKP